MSLLEHLPSARTTTSVTLLRFDESEREGVAVTPVFAVPGGAGSVPLAAGAIELVISTLAINNSIIPPTINYETPDPECDLNYTPNTAVQREVDAAISNSFGFGGHNTTLAVKRYTD